MVRTATSFTQNKMDTDLGTEPVIVIKISWKTGDVYYSDVDLALLGAEGRIMSFSGVSSNLKANNVGIVSSSGFTLSDYDGALKALYDNDIMENLPCEVSYGYKGGGISDLMLLYKGKIGTPISWSEGDRLLKFNVVSNYKDSLVGDIITVNDYDEFTFDTNADGVMKPMSFGSPRQVKAVRVNTLPVGKFLTVFPFPVAPPGSPPKPVPPASLDTFEIFAKISTGKFQVDGGENFPQRFDGWDCTIRLGEVKGYGFWLVELKGHFEDIGETGVRGNLFIIDTEAGPGGDGIINSNSAVDDLANTFKIPGGGSLDSIIEVGSRVYLRSYGGTSQGLIDYVQTRELYLINNLNHMEPLGGGGFNWQIRQVKAGWDNPNQVTVPRDVVDIPLEWWSVGESGDLSAPGDSVDLGTTGYPSSQGLYLAMDEPLISRPVWAKDLVANAIQIGNDGVPFAAEPNQTFFTGEIYISFIIQALGQSNKLVNEFPNIVDPTLPGTGDIVELGTTNTVEVMDFLITNYSNLTLDISSFESVKTKIDKYEGHFTIGEQSDVLETLESLAFQARLGLNYDGQNIKVVYLSEETDAIMDIDEKEISSKTMVLESLPITELKTIFYGTWQGYDSLDLPSSPGKFRTLKGAGDKKPRPPRRDSVIENGLEVHTENTGRFGTKEKNVNFYLYSFAHNYTLSTPFDPTPKRIINTSVRKSVDWWGHRFSNPWRIVNVVNFQNTMKLEIFDIIRFVATTGGVNVSGVAGGGLSNISKLLNTNTGGIKGVIIGTKQHPSSDRVDLKVMLESVQGELGFSGEAKIDANFWVKDNTDPLTQGPTLGYEFGL